MDKQDTDVNMDDKGLRPVTSSVADPSKVCLSRYCYTRRMTPFTFWEGVGT